MNNLFLWYPKCTTCQKAKKWLDEHQIHYEARDIKLENPTLAELTEWYEQSGLSAIKTPEPLPLKRFFNTSGLVYKNMGLAAKLPTMSKEGQLALLATDGMLVKRPLLISECKVLVGFKETEWNVLLG